MKALNINVAGALLELWAHVDAVDRRLRDEERGFDWDVLRQQWPEMMRRHRAAKGNLFEDESKLRRVLPPGSVERTGDAVKAAGDALLKYASEGGQAPHLLRRLAKAFAESMRGGSPKTAAVPPTPPRPAPTDGWAPPSNRKRGLNHYFQGSSAICGAACTSRAAARTPDPHPQLHTCLRCHEKFWRMAAARSAHEKAGGPG